MGAAHQNCLEERRGKTVYEEFYRKSLMPNTPTEDGREEEPIFKEIEREIAWLEIEFLRNKTTRAMGTYHSFEPYI